MLKNKLCLIDKMIVNEYTLYIPNIIQYRLIIYIFHSFIFKICVNILLEII